ncbi:MULTISPECIES: TrmH family RNA methyltransferase [Clostridium]|uniref:RNA methyltransferase, TrmH family n=1 Tax=Clostridium perfringens (strain ATCC 13124 / DSM 756 / JCM 1290 / NCIMB 6125 / NCTC 8237 / Type A) TaxID=195103 RepID=A0A0H2YRE4_CLOP1|nr:MULTISPECIES: RNA methyltransferase [Clostridium]ABG83488.1 RNA methyltransferase, TrmH family [Clostridium perfringens ATCC 13124]EGT0682254.1 RNA methyltransferase [Clostridium perfringens]EGT0686020.1 RNA methyltransferase [Clostridium perfringens]EGT0688771.1 RNA methyltransferase [Clostridium perfringens]EGT3620041.1 RNA methyltransferase [Clostridium perfringens]
MLEIESKNNNLFKEIKKLKEKKHRIKSNKYLIEGLRFVEEAIKSKVSIDSIIFTESFKEKNPDLFLKINENIKLIQMNETLLKQLCSTENPQGIVGVINMQNKELKSGELVVLVDKVQDPGNMGTIIRTAHAAGAAGIVMTKGTVDIYNDKTLRSTMGSIFYIPIVEDNSLDFVKSLKKEGYKLVVSSLQGKNNFFEENLQGKVMIAVGNEGNGVSDEVYDIADIKVKIPMPGEAESLNVAVATSIMIYEKIRQSFK